MDPEPSPADQEHQALDSEISTLHQQISTLKSRRQHLTSILLSTPDLPSRLGRKTPTTSRSRDPSLSPRDRAALKSWTLQQRYNLESTYRVCTGITAFRVQNPDPNAVNGGKMLGIQIESFDAGTGRFEEGYCILFDVVKPEKTGAESLRLSKHTVPACLRVERLVKQWLGGKGSVEGLHKFAKVLRGSIVRWRFRCRALEKLREEAGVAGGDARKEAADWEVMNEFHDAQGTEEDENSMIDDSEGENERGTEKERGPLKIVEIYANPEIQSLYLAWSDGTAAMLELTEDGEIVKGFARCKDGEKRKLWDLERRFPGHIGQLHARLVSYSGRT